MTVTARPHDPEKDEQGREKRWQADFSVAGNLQSVVDDINDWLVGKGMEASHHGKPENPRKAKGREGPGIVSIENERWIWVVPRK